MENYAILSLETHLFFARIMKEHGLFLEAGFVCADKACIEKADWFRRQFEELLRDAVRLGNGRVNRWIINSDELVTEFTLSAEECTEKLSGVPIDSEITRQEKKLLPGRWINADRELVSAVNSRPEIEYYQKQAARIFDSLDGGKMDAVALDQDMSLEQLAEVLQETRSDEAADREYSRQQAGEFRQAVKAEDLVLKELMAFDQPITSDNLLAAGLLMKERGKAARRLFELAEQNGSREAAEEAMEQLQENLTDKESAREAFQRLEQTYTDILEKTVYSQDPKEKLDLREMGNLFRQISLSGRLAREENYEIPVKIGEEVTSVNLRIIHNSREAGRVTVTTESAVYGRLAAQFSISIGKTEEYSLSGYMICDSREAQGMLESSLESLKKTLESSGIQTAGLNCIYKPELDLTALSGTSWIKEAEPGMQNTGTEVSTRKLYEAAKIFIGYMQKGEGLNL